jgi:hypothetical protein
MRITKNIIIASMLAAVIVLAIIPAVSAFTVTSNPTSSTLVNNQGPITLTINNLNNGDPIKLIVTASNLQTTGGTFSLPTISMPFGLQAGTATETLTSSGLTGASTVTVSRDDGSQVQFSGSGFSDNFNINSGSYTVSVDGAPTSTTFTMAGNVSSSSSTATISLPLSTTFTGTITIEVDSGSSAVLSPQTFTITPWTPQTTTQISTTTTSVTSPSTVVSVNASSTDPNIAVAITGISLSAAGTITTTTYQNLAPSTLSAYQSVVTLQGATVNNVAYTLVITKPAGVTETGSATISMSVPTSWITAQGGIANVRVIHTSDTGYTNVLSVQSSTANTPAAGYTTLTFYSPTGLCTFTLISITPVNSPSSLNSDFNPDNGPAPAAAAPPAILAPTGYSPTVVTLSHDANGMLLQDYVLETDPTAGFASALGISKGTTVVSGANQPANEISLTPLSPSTVTTALSQGGKTFAFSGFAIDGEPTGTQFVGGNVTVSFSLNQSQWAAALTQVDGNTAAMTIETYTNASGWTPIATTVNTDTYTVSASITHFSTFALFYQVTAPSPQNQVTSAATPAAEEPLSAPVVVVATTLPSPETNPGTAGNQGVVGNFVQWIQHLVSH